MKKLIIFGIIIALGIGAYVIFILNSGGELDEPSPLGTPAPSVPEAVHIKDALDTMSEAKMKEFMDAVAAAQDVVMEKMEKMPPGVELVAQGDFMRRFHSVAGRALLIRDGGGEIVRFEDFLTDNGPRLHIYLSADLGADDFIDLGQIKATKGNVNYALPADTDTGKYRYVLVWCKPFSVLFSYAELKPA
ncbi:MAG: DM13 domain-containing protein [Candidatus Liptonbacteria bacterium]|nr:DM13 domain-containing protein [Candidatus Liptonbacteria bacterium]